MTRTAVFLDGAYLDKVCEVHFRGVRVDYKRIVDEIVVNEDLLRVYYYHCLPYVSTSPTKDEEIRLQKKKRYFTAISNLPRFEVRLGRLAFRGSSQAQKPIFIQKGVDVMMAVDMVQLAATRQVEHIVIITADSDFIPAIKAVKEHGVITSIWSSPSGSRTAHGGLMEACDERQVITEELINKTRR